MLRGLAIAALAGCASLSGVGSASAALVSIVSMQYSAAHPVPHLHYEGGTSAGDVEALRQIYTTFVQCRTECMDGDGGATAVLTMNGPGGDYHEGLALADFLRANHVATVVERGMQCYSACAFAFMGGSGYAELQGVGTYVDRMVEPGGILGFHAPYRDEEAFLSAINERGAMDAQGQTRDSLALMVKELVKFNVDPEVLFYMVGMGPNETYDIVTADDYYLARIALPPTPTASWITDVPEAIANVCRRLLALDERTDPAEMVGAVSGPFERGIAEAEYVGPLSGFRLSDQPLTIGHCSVTDESFATDGDYEIALYFNTMLSAERARAIGYPDLGYAGAGLSFFNRADGWSSAGTGRNPTKRILQKGPMNHYFLPLGVPVDDLDLPGEKAIEDNRFVMRLYPLMATLPDGMEIASTGNGTRISNRGNVWLFERVGPGLLLESAFLAPTKGRTILDERIDDDSFLREGTYDGTGVRFVQLGLDADTGTTVAVAMILRGDGAPASDEDIAQLRELVCALDFNGHTAPCP
ncbi:MAG: hypothetical protein ACO1OK_01900 [Devosia sp.]